jgi:hypothetical protein
MTSLQTADDGGNEIREQYRIVPTNIKQSYYYTTSKEDKKTKKKIETRDRTE